MTNTDKVGRNDPCPCGSGKKHKQCCLGKVVVQQEKARMGLSIVTFIIGCVGAGALGYFKGLSYGLAAAAASLIVAAALYVFRDPNPPRGGSGNSAAINFGK